MSLKKIGTLEIYDAVELCEKVVRASFIVVWGYSEVIRLDEEAEEEKEEEIRWKKEEEAWTKEYDVIMVEQEATRIEKERIIGAAC